MPASNQNADIKDFEVDRRIRIGLDGLSPEERRIVEDATRSKARFLALIADPKNVERLRPNAPYYLLKITPELRLIYTQEDERIIVLDLTNQGMLDWFASMGSDRAKSASKSKKRVRHLPMLVEPCRHPHGIGKVETEGAHRKAGILRRELDEGR